MSLTTTEIEQVVAELEPLTGGFVQKVYVPEPRTAYLELRKPGASHLLVVCAEAGRTRLHVAESRPPSPEPPYALQGLLRSELIGTALTEIACTAGERLVRLRFRGREGSPELAAELTGRHGNLFLLDEHGVVRASGVPNLSSVRENVPGKPYVPPLSQTRAPYAEAPSRFAPGAEPFAVSRAIERAYDVRDRTELATERRRAMLQPLRTREQRIERTLDKVREDIARAQRADEHLRRGELLKANLGRLRRGMRELTVTDYTEEGPVEVVLVLDPARLPRETLEREFHQYRRLLAGQTRARARLAQLEGELAQVRERLAAVEALDDQALLEEARRAPPRPATPGRRAKQAPSRPFREYATASGHRIRVGRGAKENDALTFRYSKGNDVWLHARGVPGAHVVLPLERGEDPREDVLRDAALLAAHHSDARGQGVVEVAWTRVKYVRKTQGAPGAVTFSQDRTIAVRPDPDRLARLQESLAPDGALP